MEISALQRSVHAADVPMERLAGNAQVSESDKVSEVSRQFEALLLRQILGDAQKKVFASTMNPDSVAGGIYQDLITNQLADSISRSGSFGLARALEKQLQHEFTPNQPTMDGGSKV